jgi:hypothetical protein
MIISWPLNKCSRPKFEHMLMHCTEISKHVFLEMKLRSLVPNIYIYVYVSNLYIPTIGPRQTNPGNI